MSLIVTYDDDGYGGGTDLTAAYGLSPSAISIPTRAEDGDSGSGVLPFEDPAAALTLAGHKPIIVEEDECAQPRLFTGYVVERGFARSGEDGLIVGNDRLVEVNVYDQNAAAHFIIISGTDGNRPQESWADRVAWLMASDYLSPFIGGDDSFIGPWTQTMDAADYRGGYAASVLDDLCERTGDAATWYLFWSPDTTSVELFCTGEDTTLGLCTLSISNVESDIDNVTTWAPDMLAKLAREPDQTYSEVVVEYGSGQRVYRTLESTELTHVKRGTTIRRPYTKRESTAIAQADQWLRAHATERDRITCTMRSVPASSVGLVRAGMGMMVRMSHMPGYEAEGGVEMRIVMCSPVPVSDVGGLYDVSLELVGAATTVEYDLYAALLHHSTKLSTDTWPDGSMVVGFMNTGDNPPLGFGPEPTVGAAEFIDYIPVSLPYRGIRVTEGGAITLAHVGEYAYVGDGTAEVTVAVRQNGDIIASDTQTDTGGGGLHYVSGSFSFRLDDVAVEPDDEFEISCLVTGTAAFFNYIWTPGGGAESTHLRISGSTAGAYWPSGGVVPGSSVPRTSTHDTGPTVDDDASAGYIVGDQWVDSSTNSVYVLVNATDDAAVWLLLVNAAPESFSGYIGAGFDGGGSLLVAPKSQDVVVPYDSTLTGWSVYAQESGDVIFSVARATHAAFDTFTSIVGATSPALSSAKKATGTDMTGWTTSLARGDILRVTMSSVSGISQAIVVLTYDRT